MWWHRIAQNALMVLLAVLVMMIAAATTAMARPPLPGQKHPPQISAVAATSSMPAELSGLMQSVAACGHHPNSSIRGAAELEASAAATAANTTVKTLRTALRSPCLRAQLRTVQEALARQRTHSL